MALTLTKRRQMLVFNRSFAIECNLGLHSKIQKIVYSFSDNITPKELKLNRTIRDFKARQKAENYITLWTATANLNRKVNLFY